MSATQDIPWWRFGEWALNLHAKVIGTLLLGASMIYFTRECFSGYVLGTRPDADVLGGVFGMAFACCLASAPPGRVHGRLRQAAYLAILCGGLLYLAFTIQVDAPPLTDQAYALLTLNLGMPATLRMTQLARGVRR